MGSWLEGKSLAEKIKQQVKDEVTLHQRTRHQVPGLIGLLVGDNRSSQIYLRSKEKACRALGIASQILTYPGDLDPRSLKAEIEELNRRRWSSLPSGYPNAGSVFKNPPGDYAGRLIEACGLKERESGGAQISREHANVIINRGGARAQDVLTLMLAARREVAERFGVELVPELVLAGDLAARWRQEASRVPAGS